MGEEHNFVEPQDAGHWDGTTFVFNEPVLLDLGDASIRLGQLDTAHMVLPGSITPNDFVAMLLNPSSWRTTRG